MNKILYTTRKNLILISGLFWFLAGISLINKSVSLILISENITICLLSGIIIGMIKYKFILTKTALKNIVRINKLSNNVNIFKFQTTILYFLIIFMIISGYLLRKYNIVNFDILGSLYLGIGLSLSIASLLFFYYFFTNRKEIEKRILHKMIKLYCNKHHNTQSQLCPNCSDIYFYSLKQIDRCPHAENKPTCNQCETNCYVEDIRIKIKKIMKWSGPRILFYHPIYAIRYIINKNIYKRILDENKNLKQF